MANTFAPGSLVRARMREWVVLPESEPDFLVVRPLGGSGADIAGIHLGLETVESATFESPTSEDLGDFISSRLLRDACRFGFRSSAGPFRSFGRLAFTPRAYQLVPLLMALKLEVVRLLIADDVGIGKSVEAGLIAREFLDRGEITRICVLCPPHLAGQWREELRSKFSLDAVAVLASTAAKLERDLPMGRSLFEEYPITVVSTDYIKSDRRRNDFFRTCPEFVIVDEAHTCADAAGGKGTAHQRYELLSKLCDDPTRHVVLVTATPHSGKGDAFRSLLTLLDPSFGNLPDNLVGPEQAPNRKRLARHLVQRRRVDLRHFLHRETPFPDREDREQGFKLSPAYKAIFNKVLDYARESVADESGTALQRRIRWWSALSLLRSMASSPAAAVSTLRERSRSSDAQDSASADESGRLSVLDLTEDSGDEPGDIVPGADYGEEGEEPHRRRLRDFAREIERLGPNQDSKLDALEKELKSLLKEGFRPIVFCRFIPTVDHLTEALRSRFGKKVEVVGITSILAPAEREKRISEMTLGEEAKILVCTDCLSEGINLQNRFNAVVHYDLAWNPTRHEQRDGRVDRYGQKSPKIRVLTLYGLDNQIDGIVLDVLLTKHKSIRNSLGVSVPMPVDSTQIIEAIFEGLLLRSGSEKGKSQLEMFEEYFQPKKEELFREWQDAADREQRSRTVFAQESINFKEVARELEAAEEAIGSDSDVEEFAVNSLKGFGAIVSKDSPRRVNFAGVDVSVREALGNQPEVKIVFNSLQEEKVVALHRTHPWIEALASRVLTGALDPATKGPASRAGVARSSSITERSVLCLIRLRYHIRTTIKGETRSLLAEDLLLAGFQGDPAHPKWLTVDETRALLKIEPDANVASEAAINHFEKISEQFGLLQESFQKMAEDRGQLLLEAHRRVRDASGSLGKYQIETSSPDLLGVYVFLPVPKIT